jgi:uncharacterized protein (DUF1015 family)
MNLSPIFGLYPDADNEVIDRLDAAVGRALPLEAVDANGVVSRLWHVADQSVVSAVVGMLGPKPVFIADGHHRYETGLRYLEERRAAGEARDDDASANFILMMLVGMNDPGLIIQPTHRLIRGLSGVTSDQLRDRLTPCFEMQRIGEGESGARETWDEIEADGGQELLGFGTAVDGVWQTARLRSPDKMSELAGDHSRAWRGLAVSVLHVLVLDHLLADGGSMKPECRYVHLLSEAIGAIARKECDVAALVPPASMDSVATVAGGLEKMPPKSTYFYPKLLSGLVFNSLRGS